MGSQGPHVMHAALQDWNNLRRYTEELLHAQIRHVPRHRWRRPERIVLRRLQEHSLRRLQRPGLRQRPLPALHLRRDSIRKLRSPLTERLVVPRVLKRQPERSVPDPGAVGSLCKDRRRREGVHRSQVERRRRGSRQHLTESLYRDGSTKKRSLTDGKTEADSGGAYNL